MLKIIAELIGYNSNQEFCSDWWNSEDLRVYWKKWNYPVYDWMLRSIYIPVQRMGLGDFGSQLSVFLVSGLLHDYVVSAQAREVFETQRLFWNFVNAYFCRFME